MATLAYSQDAIEDLVRLAEFLRSEDETAAAATGELVRGALAILESHPLVGRRIEGDFRELIISRGRSGYVALYEYRPSEDRVIVHALRHQREAGFDE